MSDQDMLFSALREELPRCGRHREASRIDCHECMYLSSKVYAPLEEIECMLSDAVSALRYIEQRYGRLGGVGWDRVLSDEGDRVDEQMQRAGGAPDEHVTREPGSTDGSWVLTLAAIEPGNTATMPIVQLPDGATEPEWYSGEQTLTFVWADGRQVVWSWTNLLRAEYTPPIRGAR